MYNLGDDTYKMQPKIMNETIVEKILIETKKYLHENNLKKFQFIFHGGEPLLAPLSWYEKFISKTKEILINYEIFFSLQTNGILYDESFGRGLKKLNIGVGFSWDGPKTTHDKFRLYHNNKGSYEDVVKGMRTHKLINGNLAGLSVINAEITASDYYKNIKNLEISDVALLLPHLHHSMKDDFKLFKYSEHEITFGKWLVELFDIWWYDIDPLKPNISFFNEFIFNILGEKLTTESFGEGESTVLVIETNGDIETTAALKSCGNGFTKENNNIINTSIEESLNSELIKLCVQSHQNLCGICESCEIKTLCGGGRINQRYSDSNKFDNPSIYCKDIKLIVSHIQNKMLDEFSEDELEHLNLKKINYHEI